MKSNLSGFPKAVKSERILQRRLELEDFQKPAAKYAMEHDICVLGLCPNGGKTEVSIYVIMQYLTMFPNARILILTHSTNVLKDNYMDRLAGIQLNFDFSDDFDPSAQVHVCLPHSEHKIKGHYDFIIVDEAHENYLAQGHRLSERGGRVQRIIKSIKPKKQLLLTGSPSKFIKKGTYDIYTLAINEIPEKYFAKLGIELVASNYDWQGRYNADLEVEKDFVFTQNQTEVTMERVVMSLLERVAKKLPAEEFNNPTTITKLKIRFRDWFSLWEELGKTLIVCKTIKQAQWTNEILIKNGVNSTVSEHKSDKKSKQVAKFKNNEFQVLVVVERARLGYSDDDLFNIIDMSGTHNPDMIYQMFCRALRGTPDMQKYYLKVTPQNPGMMDLTKACVSAALMLTDNKFLSTFNGGNFNGILIPVLKQPRIKKPKIKNIPGNTVHSKPPGVVQFPEFTNDVVDMFRNILHNLDNPVSIYKLTTMRDVRVKLGDLKNKIWTYEEIIESARGNI